MRLVLFGPPGAGKGTQAVRLSHKLGVPHISTGDILRRNVAEASELGKKAQSYMEKGQLVPDELVVAMTERRLRHADAKQGFILDGFPRTVAQAEALAKLTPLDAAVNLFLEPEELIKRNTGRRVCPKCEAVYHVLTNPPRKDSHCDRCGTTLTIRPDDREDVVRARIETHERQSAPLIRYYRDHGLLVEVYASGLMDEIFQRILEGLHL